MNHTVRLSMAVPLLHLHYCCIASGVQDNFQREFILISNYKVSATSYKNNVKAFLQHRQIFLLPTQDVYDIPHSMYYRH